MREREQDINEWVWQVGVVTLAKSNSSKLRGSLGSKCDSSNIKRDTYTCTCITNTHMYVHVHVHVLLIPTCMNMYMYIPIT